MTPGLSTYIPYLIGLVVFLGLLLFATSRNKRNKADLGRTEQATSDLYDRVDREDKARGADRDGV